MEQSLDLDIKNYSIEDLITFFKLDNNYNSTDLDNSYKDITLNVLKSTKNLQYKYDLIEFINNGKTLLLKNIEDENKTILKKKIPKTNIKQEDDEDNDDDEETVGKIINPLSSHPVLQRQKINPKSSNSYKVHTTTTNYIFNTIYRDNYFFSLSNSSSFTLPFTIKNVTAISLSGIQVPNVTNQFSSTKGTNQIYIREDVTNIEGIVLVTSGNYTSDQYPAVLESAINTQLLGSTPNRFTVSINPYTHRLTITNSTYTFHIDIMKKTLTPTTQVCLYNIDYNTNADYVDPKVGLQPSAFVNTMGYIIGFRSSNYDGKKTYTTESVYQDTLQDYYYFELNDYTGYQFNTTIGVLPTSFLSNNIIAVLPITTPKFEASFDNNSNFIYKTRNYSAPINLKKISIKMLGPEGELIDLRSVDFSFCLQITTLYDNILPFDTQDVSLS